MRQPLTIAVAQPVCTPKDVRRNALGHVRAIHAAAARVVVFPELSLTGYELDAKPVVPGDPALGPIIRACADTDTIAFVGAPVEDAGGRSYIGTLRVASRGAELVYRKSYLGGDEPTRFSPGTGPVALVVDGRRIGFGICKDTGVEEHIHGTAALGVDVYVAGVCHLPEELGMQEERAVRIARACNAYVALASFAGSTGAPFDRTAGVSSIWKPDGTPVARADSAPGALARATIE
jgi:predicted amidohydrolase